MSEIFKIIDLMHKYQKTHDIKRQCIMSEIFKIIDLMHKYQKTHDIKRQCMTNVQYLLDCIRANYDHNAKVRAVFVCSDEDGYTFLCSGHFVIEVAGVIMEPSYEIASLKDPQYIGNYSTFTKMFPRLKGDKELLKTYMGLCERAKEINDGGMCVADNLFYHAQADWVDERLKLVNY